MTSLFMESINMHRKGMKPSPQKKIKTLSLFGDLPYGSNVKNSCSGANLEVQDRKNSLASDCESGISGTDRPGQEFRLFDNGLIRVHEEEETYVRIKKMIVPKLSACGLHAQIEGIHRNDHSSFQSQAKLQSFCIYSRALEEYRGSANVKYAWYGASKNELKNILSHGFGHTVNTGICSRGIWLSPADYPIQSLQSSVVDEDGLRHALLCRVLLGRAEIVGPDSGQCNPSSEEFDSGVDNLGSPRKYIVWSTRMNTHILPEFVVSFRSSTRFEGYQGISRPLRHPNSAWIPFSALIKELSKFVPADATKLITKHYGEYKERKITRHEMIKRVRLVAGDKLLLKVIKSRMDKIKPLHSSSSSNHND